MLIFAVLVQAAVAASPPAGVDHADLRKHDPGRVICVTEEVTGSRLARQRRCLTAAQWEDHKRVERLAVDRNQAISRPDAR